MEKNKQNSIQHNTKIQQYNTKYYIIKQSHIHACSLHSELWIMH